MKTLADLKRNAKNYLWSLKHNSWFLVVLDYQASYREVSRVQSQKIAFKTVNNGQEWDSWIDFPKAKELQINSLENGHYEIIFTRKMNASDRPDHVMIYELKPRGV